MPKPPFDVIRATFYLVAGVFAVYALMLMMALLMCMYSGQHPLTAGSCFQEGRLTEALGTLLASALAFAAGRNKGA
jgi:hypothetical protein